MNPAPTNPDLLEHVYEGLRDQDTNEPIVGTTLGKRLVAVELAESGVGVAHRPVGKPRRSPPTDALTLARWAVEPPEPDAPVGKALGIAAMNALSTGRVPWRRGDPMAALASGVDCIATVGLFRPALRKFDAVEVRVIERDAVGPVQAPDGVTVSVYESSDYATAINGVDVLFITGSSLVYGGTERYLRAAADVPTIVLIGATASFLPAPAFEAGADLLAGARVTDPAAVIAGIEEGFCGTDLHDRGLEKVYVAAEDHPPGLDIDSTPLGSNLE